MTENIEPTPASAISKLSDVGEMIERALVSEDELTREVGAIALEATQALCEALAKVPKWISVEEQSEPKEDGEYWCHGYWIGSGRKQTETAEYLGEWKISNAFVLTHWIPLPEPPKEGE